MSVGAPGRTSVPLARLVGLAALGSWGALHWGRMVAPPAVLPTLLVLALSAATAGGLISLRGRPARERRGLGALVIAVAAAGTLLCAGVPARLLAPWAWDELIVGLAEAAAGLPVTRIPYPGPDPWLGWILLAAGGWLLIAAVALTVGPRRPVARVAATIALVVLYAVPAVQLEEAAPLARGAVFTVLLAGFLWFEGVARPHRPAAAAALGLGVVAALALAGRADSPRPWIDYETLVESLLSPNTVSFDFEHRYGRLDWPRQGRQMLRVTSQRRTYWKAVNLDVFDGRRWVRSRKRFGATLSDELPPRSPRRASWTQTIEVDVRRLRSTELIGPGTTLLVRDAPSAPVPGPSPGEFRLERALGPDDSYRATGYAPAPDAEQLASAPATYPQLAGRYLETNLRPGAAPYSRTWRLARRLRADVGTPQRYVQRVLDHLGRGYAYSEAPPQRAAALEAFLFDDRVGYCQQFSGAMALLLRMGGVPARVVGGFAPGSYDAGSGTWTVRDLDAHSWVEAYFPGIGWATFDPTPADAPPRSQLSQPLPAGGATEPGQRFLGGDRPEPGPAASRPSGGGDDPGTPWGRIGAGLAVLAALTAVGVVALRRRPAGGAQPADDALVELRRALRRSGRSEPGLTLQRLEHELGARDPGAARYLRALRGARFGHGARPPTPAQRRGLRRALAGEAGRWRRLRALWALPPRPPGRGSRVA